MTSFTRRYETVHDELKYKDIFDDDVRVPQFDESILEQFSQEIEDNIINENREAELRKKYVMNANTDNKVIAVPYTTATDTVINNGTSSSTGAIPKSAFSYLSSSDKFNIITAREAKINSGNHSNPEDFSPRSLDLGIKSLNSDKGLPGFVTPISAGRPSSLQDKSSEETVLNTERETKSEKKIPGKLRPEAFDFLKHRLELTSDSVNDAVCTKNSNERKHLVSTAFVPSAKSHNYNADEQSFTLDNNYEWSEIVPSAPPLPKRRESSEHFKVLTPAMTVQNVLGDSGSYATNSSRQSEILVPRNTNEIVVPDIKPPLPARPPPVFRYPIGTFSRQDSSTNVEERRLSTEWKSKQNVVEPQQQQNKIKCHKPKAVSSATEVKEAVNDREEIKELKLKLRELKLQSLRQKSQNFTTASSTTKAVENVSSFPENINISRPINFPSSKQVVPEPTLPVNKAEDYHQRLTKVILKQNSLASARVLKLNLREQQNEKAADGCPTRLTEASGRANSRRSLDWNAATSSEELSIRQMSTPQFSSKDNNSRSSEFPYKKTIISRSKPKLAKSILRPARKT